jgi:monovalent cation:proton antiporter-2 (CPA2) family protein
MENNYLNDILILLLSAIITVPLFRRLGFGSVLGYLTAGAIVGPWGMGFIDTTEEIQHIAEFGVVFLLFIIGIELKPERLWSMKKLVFGLGFAQLMVTGLVIAGITQLFGQSTKTAIIIGFGLALSSTAFGLQILTERKQMGTQYGRTAFSILLLQDLAVVPLLTLVSLLAHKTTPLLEGIEFAILEAILVVSLVYLAGRYFLSPILKLVATSKASEVFTAAAVFSVLGTAWLMHEIGLSLALGAFLAGLMMADSQYRHQIIADIEPFRGILLGLFFISVGMSIDFGLLAEKNLLVAGLVIALLLIKSILLLLLGKLLKVSNSINIRTALLLSQSGEFGFVLFGLAFASGLLDEQLFHLLALIIAITMVATPFMSHLGEYIHKRLHGETQQHDVSTEHISDDTPHVIIAGCGRVGKRIARIMELGNIPYLAIDKNPDQVLLGRHEGFSVFYGDASKVDVLRAAGIDNAGVIVCTLDSAQSAIRLVKILRQNYPDIPIHARGHDKQHCQLLLKAGATVAISETVEASVQLAGTLLDSMGLFEEECIQVIENFRDEYYGDGDNQSLFKRQKKH